MEETNGGPWSQIRKGKVWTQPGRNGGSSSGSGGSGIPPAPGGRSGGGSRTRTKLGKAETRAKISERPNTVVIECREFLALPSVVELASFLYENVMNENKELIPQVEAVYMDEYNKKYLLKMRSSDSMDELVLLLSEGVSWPGYRNEVAGRDVRVYGYSMEKPIMDITISGVEWWTTREMITKAASQWGEVKDVIEGKVEKLNFSFKSDVWTVKLVKKPGVEIPVLVHHLLGLEEREVWKIWYRRVPKVCYGCLQHGHIMRDCKAAPVSLDTLGTGPGLGEIEISAVDVKEEGPDNDKMRTFAQVLRGDNFKSQLELKLSKKKEEEAAIKRQKEEKAAKEEEVRRKKELQRKEKDERQKIRKMEREQQKEEEYGNKDDIDINCNVSNVSSIETNAFEPELSNQRQGDHTKGFSILWDKQGQEVDDREEHAITEDEQEFMTICKNLTDEQVNIAFAKFDESGDDKLDYRELCHMINKKAEENQ